MGVTGMRVDMHYHTNVSDGSLSPEKPVSCPQYVLDCMRGLLK